MHPPSHLSRPNRPRRRCLNTGIILFDPKGRLFFLDSERPSPLRFTVSVSNDCQLKNDSISWGDPLIHELTLSQAEARRLTDEVKADAQRLWAKLLKLYEGGAHIALGYASWAEYCEQEFQMKKAHAYRLLKAAQILETTLTQSPIGDSFKVTSQVPESEALARELVPLIRNPQALDEAWNEAVEQAGGVPTAQGVHEVVARSPISPISYRPSMWPGLSGKDGPWTAE
jgi:hypothetical protein